MSNNIFVPIKMPVSLLQLTVADEAINLYDTVKDAMSTNTTSRLDRVNAVRIYVHSGTMGILLDGNAATQENCLKVESEQHFIENIDPRYVSLIGVGGDCIITVQMGHIS